MVATILVLTTSHAVCGESWRHGFDGPRPTWTVEFRQTGTQRTTIVRHDFQTDDVVCGRAAERVRLHSVEADGSARLQCELPAARQIDDLRLRVWLKSDRARCQLALRLVFPHQHDPRTGQALTTIIRGGSYTTVNEWQPLTCQVTDAQVRRQIRRLRSELRLVDVDTREPYVDAAIVLVRLQPGEAEILLDELTVGPIVAPRQLAAWKNDEAPDTRVHFRSNRFLLDGRPAILRVIPFHGEGPRTLEDARVNLALIPDFRDESLLSELRYHGIGAVASPPTDVRADRSLAPFDSGSSNVLAWFLGAEIPAGHQRRLIAVEQQVRNADREMHRPLWADVTGNERVYSRHVEILGTSRPIIGTTTSFRQYRQLLERTGRLARPDCHTTTRIQTEPSSADQQWRLEAGRILPVIEYEQIRLQVYIALAAGCRGLMYWTTTPLDSQAPGHVERRFGIKQINLEVELLEDLLATGRVESHIPFHFDDSGTNRPGGSGRDSPAGPAARNGASTGPAELEAALIQTGKTILLLPIYYEPDAQFVPGRMAGKGATLVVPAPELAQPWLVTTTGIRSLERERVNGGLRITIPEFDQTAAIILTTDHRVPQQLQSRVDSGIAEASARCQLELARARLERVRTVDAELRQLGAGVPAASARLDGAARDIQRAADAMQRNEYSEVAYYSRSAMQFLRILQKQHWQHAVRRLSSPVSTDYTICFQTLPDFWRMVRTLGASRQASRGNLLPSGDFEQLRSVTDAWRHVQHPMDGVAANAELISDAKQGRYSLRQYALPARGHDPPTVVRRQLVSVTSPEIPVKKGQILHVAGWVKVPRPVAASVDGVMLYDNLRGPAAAIRWHHTGDWERFELIRDIHRAGAFHLSLAVAGLGEVLVDGLRIVTYDQSTEPAILPVAAEQPPNGNPLRLRRRTAAK